MKLIYRLSALFMSVNCEWLALPLAPYLFVLKQISKSTNLIQDLKGKKWTLNISYSVAALNGLLKQCCFIIQKLLNHEKKWIHSFAALKVTIRIFILISLSQHLLPNMVTQWWLSLWPTVVSLQYIQYILCIYIFSVWWTGRLWRHSCKKCYIYY